jgi:hypothetical protein
MRISKSTNKELVEELTARNLDGRYDQLIKNAVNNFYHDYKAPEEIVCGKMELVKDLSNYPELGDISTKVMEGEYDEVADEEDKAQMRAELPKSIWDALGLNPDEDDENTDLKSSQS